MLLALPTNTKRLNTWRRGIFNLEQAKDFGDVARPCQRAARTKEYQGRHSLYGYLTLPGPFFGPRRHLIRSLFYFSNTTFVRISGPRVDELSGWITQSNKKARARALGILGLHARCEPVCKAAIQASLKDKNSANHQLLARKGPERPRIDPASYFHKEFLISHPGAQVVSRWEASPSSPELGVLAMARLQFQHLLVNKRC